MSDEVTEGIAETVVIRAGEDVRARFVTMPERLIALQNATFDAGSSLCTPSDRISEYHWNFGDGNQVQTASTSVDHNFQQAGYFKVRLGVVTEAGRISEVQKSVRVGFRLKLECEPRCPMAGRAIRIVAKPVVNLDAEDAILEYAWDLDCSGEFKQSTDDGELYTEVADPGAVVVRVRATSRHGISEEASHTFTVYPRLDFSTIEDR